MNSKDTLDEVAQRINQLILDAEQLQTLDKDQLNHRPGEGKWNALECMEHMNRYSDFYIIALNDAISKAREPWADNYKPSWLGNKSAMDMLPQDGVLPKTMKTFKSKNPSLDGVGNKVIEKFIKDQKDFLNIVDLSRNVSLEKTKSKTTLPLIRFNLGDTLRFVIYHEVRHMLQAQKAGGIIVNG